MPQRFSLETQLARALAAYRPAKDEPEGLPCWIDIPGSRIPGEFISKVRLVEVHSDHLVIADYDDAERRTFIPLGANPIITPIKTGAR